MAESLAHKWGQIIGDALEAAVLPLLEQFASQHQLYLEKKVTLTDKDGNKHDLDFVLNKAQTPKAKGTPLAFIEAAWRRYTKHSKNKVQEIQGAIVPLVETYSENAPFYGAILAGEFTHAALTQLESLGFAVAYFAYDAILKAFRRVGIDASSEDKVTPEDEFAHKIRQWEALSANRRSVVYRALITLNQRQVDEFMSRLDTAVSRKVKSVRVFPLHGVPTVCPSVQEAIRFIEAYDEANRKISIARYEVQVLYSNGDKIQGDFASKAEAVQFLRKLFSAV